MSTPDLRAQLPALSAAGDAVTASAWSIDAAAADISLLPPASVDAALPGSATSIAFRSAVRAWAVVSRSLADELRTLGLRLGESAEALRSTDAGLACRLTERVRR